MASAIAPVVVALTVAEQTIVSAVDAERVLEHLMLESQGSAVNPAAPASTPATVTIRIKNAANGVVKEFANIAVSAKDASKPGSGLLYLWDSTVLRRLPPNWTVTGFASAANVLTAEVGGVSK